MIKDYSHLSPTITGLQTKIIIDTDSKLILKDVNITIQNMTFMNCDSIYFKIIDSTLSLFNVDFYGNGDSINTVLLNMTNCTSNLTQVYFENHSRPLIFSNSSILFSQHLYFDNVKIESLNKSIIYLITSSFEGGFAKLRYSNISHFIFLDNSNIYLSKFNSLRTVFTSILIHSVFSNVLIKDVNIKKCHGPILSSINDSTFHISNIQVLDHSSDNPLFTVINSTLSVFDSIFQESQIDSIATLKACSTFIFTNSTILYLIVKKTLFELQKTNSAEFSQITIYRLVSQSDIGIIHAICSDYTKVSQTLIEGFVSQTHTSTAFVFSDVSSIYLDDFNYTRNGVPLMIVKQTNVVFANSYLNKNDCIEYTHPGSSEDIPSSFITLLPESSLHLINSQIIGNTVYDGFSLLSVNSLIFFMKVTFSKNKAPINFIQSDVKLSKSVFKNNLNTVIESRFSNINIHKCLFSSGKKLQIYVGNESKIVVNTTIVNSSHFIEADPSAYSVTIGSGRFLYSYKKAMVVDTKRTKLSLLDTKFNCSKECEKFEITNDINDDGNLIDDNENIIRITKKQNDNIYDDQIADDKRQLSLPTSHILKMIDKKIIRKENQTNLEQIQKISSSVQNQNNRENSSVINLPNSQLDFSYQVCLVVVPIFFLFTIFIYRFKSPRFRKISKKIFSPKGRYQL